MAKHLLAFFLLFALTLKLQAQGTPLPPSIQAYILQHPDDGKPSTAQGTVSAGKLQNGKLIPYAGPNFSYFDTTSYLRGRAFVHHKVLATLLQTYRSLSVDYPDRHFYIMECANQAGGTLPPHRTHQNGLSVDLMVPLLRDSLPYTALDQLGAQHYLLEFDDQGRYTQDPKVLIDFELLAHHILLLGKVAAQHGLRISKVILRIELKDELFATTHVADLNASGIYFAKSLTPLINSLHDDHFHVDFEPIK